MCEICFYFYSWQWPRQIFNFLHLKLHKRLSCYQPTMHIIIEHPYVEYSSTRNLPLCFTLYFTLIKLLLLPIVLPLTIETRLWLQIQIKACRMCHKMPQKICQRSLTIHRSVGESCFSSTLFTLFLLSSDWK